MKPIFIFACLLIVVFVIGTFFRGTRLPIPQGLRSFFSNSWNQVLVVLVLASGDSLYGFTGLAESNFSSLFSFLLDLGGRFLVFLFFGGLIGFTIFWIETKDEESE
jgi:hypothetical protein